ncbi:MAG: hypothetical protein CVV22_08670 [Ignavibacteriae bacterium HGW-Ignavibacteriae-1]|jgi:hypothetical protein|nr:MAG: hypothetical protein CVV22_08670 [Ignavibacteriae bacterium HGW-Ignavibacteriae-1]
MKTEQDIRNKVKIFRPTSQEVNLFDPNLNDKSTRLFKFKDDKENRFKIWVFTNSLKLEIPFMTSLLFSINIADKVCFADKKLKEINGIGKIYTDNSENDQVISCIEMLKDELKTLDFDNSEGLTIYRNSLQLTLNHKRHLLPEIEVGKRIKTIIEQNFPDKIKGADYSDLPTDLRQILLKFENLAITDDFERDELIEGVSTKQRKDIIKVIEPKLEEINKFLDTFGDKPLTDGAIGLQCLAELTIELTNDEKKNHS